MSLKMREFCKISYFCDVTFETKMFLTKIYSFLTKSVKYFMNNVLTTIDSFNVILCCKIHLKFKSHKKCIYLNISFAQIPVYVSIKFDMASPK